MSCFGLVLDIGELTHIGPLAQYSDLPSMPCLSIVFNTLEQSLHFFSLSCFCLVLDIGELTPICSLEKYPKLPSMLCLTMVFDTLELFPHSSLPCFNLVLDIDEVFSLFYMISSQSLNCFLGSIFSTTQQFSTSYLLLHPFSFVYVYPFLMSSIFFCIFSFNFVFCTCRHFSSQLAAHEFTLTRVFLHYFLGVEKFLYVPTPPHCDAPTRCLVSL